MAVVDATYKFVYVDIGAYGSQSDGGVFKACSLGEHLCNGTLDIPNYTLNSNEQVPVCLVADSAFQLHRHLMKPYPSRGLNHSRRIFNYRLSRARRCVENAFGILASRWRVFLRPLGQAPSTVEKIVKAAIVLHNMLGTTSEYAPAGYGNTLDVCGNIVEGEWRSNIESVALSALQPLPLSSHVRQHTEDAKEIRDKYRKYFVSSQGEVP